MVLWIADNKKTEKFETAQETVTRVVVTLNWRPEPKIKKLGAFDDIEEETTRA